MQVTLSLDDIQSIVDTLVYDCRVEDFDQDPVLYRPASVQLPASTPLTALPCGVCPVFMECKEGGPINPQACQYWDEWF